MVLELAHLAGFDVFAQPIIFAPAAGPPVSIRGVFRAAGTYVDSPTNARIQVASPMLDVLQDELPGGAKPKSTDRFIVNDTTYQILSIEPDGEGVLTIGLTRGP